MNLIKFTTRQLGKFHNNILCYLGAFLFLFATSSYAIDAVEKILINADHMQMNIESGKSVYTGHVKISQGELILTGDKVTVVQKDDELDRITVIGKPARYNHVTESGDSIEAESEHMVYIASQNKLVLTKNAHLTQPDHKLSSPKIIYDTLKKTVIAGNSSAKPTDGSTNNAVKDNNQRVNITLTPKKQPSETSTPKSK